MALFTNKSAVREKDLPWPGVSWAIGLVVAYVLLATAIAHLGNPYQFLSAIRAYQLIPWIPQAGAEVGAVFLPFLHVTLALCLITRYVQHLAFRIGFGLFSLYTVVQMTAFARGLKVGCGCFGSSEDLIGVRSIGLAAVLSFTCLLGCWLSRFRRHDLLPTRLSAAGDTGSWERNV